MCLWRLKSPMISQLPSWGARKADGVNPTLSLKVQDPEALISESRRRWMSQLSHRQGLALPLPFALNRFRLSTDGMIPAHIGWRGARGMSRVETMAGSPACIHEHLPMWTGAMMLNSHLPAQHCLLGVKGEHTDALSIYWVTSTTLEIVRLLSDSNYCVLQNLVYGFFCSLVNPSSVYWGLRDPWSWL